MQVRAQSIKALWEYEDDDLVPVLLRLLHDPEALVRGEAALGLGRFLLRMEVLDRDDALVSADRRRAAGARSATRPSSTKCAGARSRRWACAARTGYTS